MKAMKIMPILPPTMPILAKTEGVAIMPIPMKILKQLSTVIKVLTSPIYFYAELSVSVASSLGAYSG
jgi:hypothetical protein